MFNHENSENSDDNNLDDISDFENNNDIISNPENIHDNVNDSENNDLNHNNYPKNFQKPVDVRIIVKETQNFEFLSKAIKNVNIEDKFNIIISSIIPINNIEIAKNAVQGADIILIATDSDKNDKKLISSYYKHLKNDFNYVEPFKFPKSRNVAITDIKIIEKEILNSIIRIGLSSIFNTAHINRLKINFNQIKEKYENSIKNNEKLNIENDVIISEAEELREENEDLLKEIKRLKTDMGQIKLDFSDFKSRFSDIYSKNLLEVFPLAVLWEETFNEILEKENMVVIATNKFKPDNIVIGQGFIGAYSKEEAIEWLKIVNTALIFVNNNFDALKEEFNNIEKDTSDGFHTTLNNKLKNDKIFGNKFKKEKKSNDSDILDHFPNLNSLYND